MDFADASLVLLAEHLGHGRILSTDRRDFHTYRWKNTQRIRLDCVSNANHNLNRLLDKPGGHIADGMLYIRK
jgi:hypothetical protein